jgi:hypothetical protein
MLKKKILIVTKNLDLITSKWVSSDFITDLKKKYLIKTIKLNSKNINVNYKNVSLVINFLSDSPELISILRKLKKRGIPICSWSIDPDLQLLKMKEAIKLSNLIAISQLDSFNAYKNYELFRNKCIYLPYGVSKNLVVNGLLNKEKRQKKYAFFGTAHGARIRFLRQLQTNNLFVDTNIEFKDKNYFFGKFLFTSSVIPKKNIYIRSLLIKFSVFFGGIINKLLFDSNFSSNYLTDKVLISKTQKCYFGISSHIHRNTDLTPFLQFKHIRMRDFELLAIGCLLVADYSSDINYLKKTGLKIFSFKNNKDILLINKKLINMSDLQIKKTIYKNLKILIFKHTWQNRVKKIFQEIKKS